MTNQRVWLPPANISVEFFLFFSLKKTDWPSCALARCRGVRMTDSAVIFSANNMPDLMEIWWFTLSSLCITVCLLISVAPSGSAFTSLHRPLVSVTRPLVLFTIHTCHGVMVLLIVHACS